VALPETEVLGEEKCIDQVPPCDFVESFRSSATPPDGAVSAHPALSPDCSKSAM
jgi:hypothetical protein